MPVLRAAAAPLFCACLMHVIFDPNRCSTAARSSVEPSSTTMRSSEHPAGSSCDSALTIAFSTTCARFSTGMTVVIAGMTSAVAPGRGRHDVGPFEAAREACHDSTGGRAVPKRRALPDPTRSGQYLAHLRLERLET